MSNNRIVVIGNGMVGQRFLEQLVGRVPGPSEVTVFRQTYPPSFGEPLERTRQHEARGGDEIPLAQDDVCRKVARSPTLDQGGHGRPQLLEHVAQLLPLLRIEREPTHPAEN